jgi:YVTN family beta-propeller protein
MGRFTHLARLGGLSVIVALAAAVSVVAPAAAEPATAGHVYVQTNDAAGNHVVAFSRASDGTLTQDQSVATGGTGIAPVGLGSQASIAITDDGEHLLVVNAGSDDVSLFDASATDLRLADVTRVGDRPVSVAVSGSLVYVLDQGADAIQGLRITDEDTLVRIPKSSRPLSGSDVGGAQVAFGHGGRILAVTEKNTQLIDTYVVRSNGRAAGHRVQPSSGPTPFGFQFGPDGRLYVSEAPMSAVSSYDVARDGTLSTITASLSNGQGAACWLVVSTDGRFAYTANAATGNVSEYDIASNGALSLVGDGNNGSTAPGPVDLDLSSGDGFLYVLSARSGSIAAFRVGRGDGSLTPIDGPSGLGLGWAGMIAV